MPIQMMSWRYVKTIEGWSIPDDDDDGEMATTVWQGRGPYGTGDLATYWQTTLRYLGILVRAGRYAAWDG